MNALEAAALVGLLVIPFHILVQHLLRHFPEHVRASGVAIDDERVLEARGEVIGTFCGSPIYAWVCFFGMTYRFERIVSRQRGPRERELVLQPGLLYLTD